MEWRIGMQVNPESVILKVGELGLIDIIRPVGDWYMCRCPIHNNGQEKKPSCGISLHEQYRNNRRYPALHLHCFSCGYTNSLADALTEVLKRKGLGKSGIDWLKENVPGFDEENIEFDYLIPQDLSSAITSKYAIDYINSQIVSESNNFVPESELASYRMTVPYMYKRGLTDEIIEQYDIGYDANFIPPGRKKPMPCITFPVKDQQGRTLFLCRRSIEGKFFHYPQGVEKSVYGLYELPKGVKSVIICESCLNALRLRTFGYHAVALLGTGTSYEIDQLKQLGVPEFILCLDGDEAGHRGAAKLKRALSKVAIVWTVHMPPDKDANDCKTKEEFDQYYNARD